MINCPCINCICLPICRSKSYSQLVTDCKLAVDFVIITPGPALNPIHRDSVRMRSLYSILKPTKWRLLKSTFKNRDTLTVQWTEEGLEYVRKRTTKEHLRQRP
jgi:hypothetical protein